MDAMMLIELLDDHRRVQARQRVSGAGQTMRIGRSLTCDLALDDPYAAAEHTLLTLQTDGRVHVQDLGTRNGTRVDGERIPEDEGRSIEQGELLIGRSRLRLRTLHASIPPERLFRRDLLRRHRTLLASLGVLSALSCAAFLQWLDAPESLLPRQLIAMLITLAGLSLWTGLWSLIAHLNHGIWQVRIHLAIAANGLAWGAWSVWLYQLGSFATQWRWLEVVTLVWALALGVLLLYLHLRNATYLLPTPSLLLAASASLLLGGSLWLIHAQSRASDVNHMTQEPTLQPGSLLLAPALETSDYLKDTTTLQRAANSKRQTSLVNTPLPDEGGE